MSKRSRLTKSQSIVAAICTIAPGLRLHPGQARSPAFEFQGDKAQFLNHFFDDGIYNGSEEPSNKSDYCNEYNDDRGSNPHELFNSSETSLNTCSILIESRCKVSYIGSQFPDGRLRLHRHLDDLHDTDCLAIGRRGDRWCFTRGRRLFRFPRRLISHRSLPSCPISNPKSLSARVPNSSKRDRLSRSRNGYPVRRLLSGPKRT